LDQLLESSIRAGEFSKLKLPGLPEERVPVFVGGLAILAEIFEVLGIKSMRVAEGALREGLLYDMVGRLTDEDARVRSVRAMQGRFHVDSAQAERVEATAVNFLRQTATEWGLEDALAEQLLSWAARVHEVGLDVSHSHYHKHGAYLLEHADLPGFPQEEQRILACVVGGHRRKLPREALQELSPPWHIKAEFLIVLLRLSVLLHRGRSGVALPQITLTAKGHSLEMAFPRGWLDDHPLTAADLELETEYLKSAGFKLRIV
jgi:exopolyphosphatase/guanosine-5'-triphosphate,3'-diphosphate pyrophosphatase